MERSSLFTLIHGARNAGRYDFARALAADWLAVWPGDLEVQFTLAQIELHLGSRDACERRLNALIRCDPEYEEAYWLLSKTLSAASKPSQAAIHEACAMALRRIAPRSQQSLPWAAALTAALQALDRGDGEQATRSASQALEGNLGLPLPTWVAVRATRLGGNQQAALAIARTGLERWPQCIPFKVLIARELLNEGETARGVELLHQTVAEDPIGSASRRVLGADHPYANLWPETLSAPRSRPIPAEVSAVLGDNRLLAGPSHAEQIPAAESPKSSVPLLSASSAAPIAAEAVTPRAGPAPQAGERTARPAGRRSAVEQAGGATPAASAPLKGAGRRRKIRHARASAEQPPLPKTSRRKNPGVASLDDFPKPEPWEAFRGPNPGDAEVSLNPWPSEEIEAARADFERLAQRLKIESPDAEETFRIPAYIVLSSQTRLMQAMDEERFQQVQSGINQLTAAVRRRPRWKAYSVYIDEPSSLSAFGLSPVDPGNAWQIKLRLADLDAALAERGEMIGALLIVGDHSVIPFHMLPNPTDDDDDEVPSDNPYATQSENYLAPEWPVGRFPTHDPGLLQQLLEDAAAEHQSNARSRGMLQRLRSWFARRMARWFGTHSRATGYTASIWRKASVAVFKTIGESRNLVTSPPVEAGRLPSVFYRPARFSYFNLHGIEDAPEWFGQRDPLRDPEAITEFPVALRPEDVVNSGRAPEVVYTEACYGANTLGKTARTALALRFLEAGSQAVVGSTKISYGSVSPPLIAADLLGKLFWDYLKGSLSTGEALRRAKLQLANEMTRRQGFIDGEDQKTLISFVLYGDPLCVPRLTNSSTHKTSTRRMPQPAQMKTVCELGGGPTVDELSPEAMERVKSMVSRYLPGMLDANCQVAGQRHVCSSETHSCATHQIGRKGVSDTRKTFKVTLSKDFNDGLRSHARYARLTLDDEGRVLKLAVSR